MARVNYGKSMGVLDSIQVDSASLYSGSKNEDSSDDAQSLNLAPSLPSDNASVASDYQDEGSPECEFHFD
ncbi:UNVERIFIED_CONTAM: hypothetical protein FKN15_023884 [Acipenser sinensis]